MELNLDTNPRYARGDFKRVLPSRPEICGFFSGTGQGQIGVDRIMSYDCKNLRYYNHLCPSPSSSVKIDLEELCGNTIKKDRSRKRDLSEILASILTYLSSHKENFKSIFDWKYFDPTPSFLPSFVRTFDLSDAPIVCQRGFLTFISSLPYQPRNEVDIYCSLYKGTIYLYASRPVEERTDVNIKMSDWGYVFEKYMVADSPRDPPNLTGPITQTDTFGCVFRMKFGNHRVIYHAEIDGLIVEDDNFNIPSDISHDEAIQLLNGQKFIELKTKMEITSLRQETLFSKSACLAWWLQSLYGRCEYILCGYRDDNGIVKSIKKYPVSELPKYSDGFWDKDYCLSFCNSFFEYVKDCFLNELRKLNIKDLTDLRNTPNVNIVLNRKKFSPIKLDHVYSGDSKIIPEWYRQIFEN